MNLKAIVPAPFWRKRLTNVIVTAFLLITPLIGICQPPGPGDGGAVNRIPFDNNMNLVFLLAGILFAVIITVRQLRKRVTAN